MLNEFSIPGLIALPWWGDLLVVLALTHVTIAAVTIYLHRNQAHRALDLHPVVSHFFRLWLWLTTGMVTKEWAAIHRKHHAKCETPEDPHSPQIYGLSRVLWGGVFLYVREARNRETIERYGRGTPEDWIERRLYSRFPALGIAVMALIDVALFGLVAGLAIWAVQMAWIPFWAAGVINGIGHYWGYRNWECADASRNIFPLGILIGGEELHNNHHAFATSARLSSKWYEFDLGWLYIRILQAFGLARVKKLAPRPRLAAARPAVDFDTLQAVLTYRHDVMAKFVASLRRVYREELARLRQVDARLSGPFQARALWRALLRDGRGLAEAERARLDAILDRNSRLATLMAMRRELTTLWERSNASSEQLLRQLQDWCARAEASGIAQLREMTLTFRRYAL
ncbi:MAG TPA: acyl-CoA desaturase [Rhodocyclaceae bacterium]|nr:MAG: acyl-CoA desaturase [Betaproteobacteria bacterium CG2_30_68_42]PIX75871.1 MAG: acyl-CoA desaturase [Rhodocyclales bacterium CG_4_10_14_3_um_filter_68_10]PJA57069.1 MAG: acyl-CoA desaturase [Rhodocyclales bacterium CG_4_9_14_3_um_filter_68_10]HCX33316.1 acyl-CoA desaturase [Rhodocyclaceae bacterium]